MKKIKLNKNKITLVDDEDFELLSKYKWYARHGGKYMGKWRVFGEFEKNKIRKRISMSRFILNPPPDMLVDHINRNPLDNRRCNLRLCTPKENARNRSPQRPGRFKGVHKNNKNSWMAVIKVDGYLRYIGTYDSQAIAAQKYNEAAKEIFGDFACINKIPQ